MRCAWLLVVLLGGIRCAGWAAEIPGAADAIQRIREEGLERSQVMKTASHLTDVIGPRLTGSPNLDRANRWTVETLKSWGLVNARLEPWGPFGRGWSLKQFSAQIIEPHSIPLIAYPKAWSPGLEKPVIGKVVHVDAQTDEALEQYKGKLEGAMVLAGRGRVVAARFEPLAARESETDLLLLANSSGPRQGQARANQNQARGRRGGERGARGERAGAPGRRGGRGGRQGVPPGRLLAFLLEERASVALTPSNQGDGGTLFVAAAGLPGAGGRGAGTPRVWSTNAPATLPQITVAIEDYNRMTRMLDQGVELEMKVELQTEFHEDDLMAYNVTAEIPGSDLKDQVVMLGGHIDSWHSGTGATDNAAGVAAAMEAMRIIAALDLKPRRTIRLGLWSGEEQGLFGSHAYVAEHFGYVTNTTEGAEGEAARQRLVKTAEYDNFSGYFNLDNGTGKIRGVYMEGNELVRPLFRSWLAPFADLDAATLTLAPTGGTDHQSFDRIGLPGFQFIQDPIEYETRTHHSNADVFDRLQEEDLKQAATIMAAFAYQAAMLDERLPRKKMDFE